MKSKEEINAKAMATLARLTIDGLVSQWEKLNDLPYFEEEPIVRGWVLDELERRDKAAFDAWLSSDDSVENIRKFFKVA